MLSPGVRTRGWPWQLSKVLAPGCIQQLPVLLTQEGTTEPEALITPPEETSDSNCYSVFISLNAKSWALKTKIILFQRQDGKRDRLDIFVHLLVYTPK